MTAAVEDVPGLDVVGEGDHANCLPDTKTNTRGNTTVQPLEAVLGVDVLQCVEYGELGRAVGIGGSSLGHTLHLPAKVSTRRAQDQVHDSPQHE